MVGDNGLDNIDKAIIRHLQEDGRMSYVDLGPLVGLSPAAVRQRVLQLTESGIMQIVAVTDPIKLGFDSQAMVGLNATGDLDAVAGQLERITEIDYLVITTGRFDLLAEVVTTSAEHLLVTIGQMRAIEGVTTTEVFGYLRLEKQSYDWGTR
jgi:Lrp/AsnC family transcriptional regulator for asnA, asnC and gidA